MPKKLFIIRKIVSSFEIHNLEGNQMYFKNIGLHFAYLYKLKRKIIYEKKIFAKLLFFFFFFFK